MTDKSCLIKKSYEVDVIIVTYNQENFIGEAIESVLSQTYDNIAKIIITDDGSDDRTPEIIKSYSNNHKLIQPIFSQKNTGLAYNINRAFKKMEAEYISIMAGDDLMLPEKIEKQVKYLNENPDVIACAHDMDVFKSVGKSMGNFSEIISFKKSESKMGVESLFDASLCQCPSSIMYKKDVIPKEGFDTRLKYLNDFLFDFEVLRKGKLGYIDEVLGRYRQHEKNLTKSSDLDIMALEETLMTYSIIIARYPEYYGLVRKKRASLYFFRVLKFIQKGEKAKARNVAKILFFEGSYIKGSLAYFLSFIISQEFLRNMNSSKNKNKIIGYILKFF